MNWRRGFIRFWLVISVAWILFSFFVLDIYECAIPCLFGNPSGNPFCNYTKCGSFWPIALSLPVGSGIFGIAVYWIISGFARRGQR